MLVLLLAVMSDKGGLEPPRARRGLFLLTFLDLLLLGRHRLVDVAPWKPLVEQSPVLESLAREPRGTRVADLRTRNLPMRVGLAPISAYHTLDLPVVGSLNVLAMGSPSDRAAWQGSSGGTARTGSGVRLFDPIENRADELLKRARNDREVIDDPALASLLFGASWVAEQGPWARKFSMWRPEVPAARAWFLPGRLDLNEAAIADDWSGDPRQILRVLQGAIPLPAESRTPEQWTILIEAAEPGWVIVSQVGDPQWKAQVIDQDGLSKTDVEILPAFRRVGESTGWQCVPIPTEGRWTLRLEYDANDVLVGLTISLIAWTGWLVVVLRGLRHVATVRSGRCPTRRRLEVTTKIGVALVGRLGLRGARADSQSCAGHPHAELTVATSRSDEEPRLEALHPSLARRTNLRCEPFDAARLAARAAYAFLALPHTASMAIVPELRGRGVRVIDLSADYRLADAQVYEDWYGHAHTDAGRLPEAVYGLPELFREQIPSAGLIANPGCYTSASILALAPLVAGGSDRAGGDHHRRQERGFRRRAFAQADDAFPRMQREPLGLQRGPAPAYAGDRPGLD